MNLMPTNSIAWVKWRNPLADKLPKLTCSLKKIKNLNSPLSIKGTGCK